MKRFTKIALLALMGWGLPCAAAAQTAAPPAPPRVVAVEERDRMAIEQAAGLGGRYVVGVEMRVTTAKPYSAEAVTESLQVLGDGNRIAKKSVTRVYRDNDGRTRREQMAESGQPTSITISDPVGGLSYTLDPQTKVAFQAGAVRAPSAIAPSGYGSGGGTGGRGGAVAVAGVPTVAVARSAASPTETPAQRDERLRQSEQARAARIEQAETSQAAASHSKQVVELAASGRGQTSRENLGEQMIEGVRATGTRNTTIIPAGSPIGNVNEIRVVSEQWFSPDLEVLVMTRHSDPRVGETIYRLTNIVRAQPDPNLFSVPPDYKIQSRSVRSPQ